MPPGSPGFVKNVDEMIAETQPAEVAAFYGYPWPEHASGNEVRMDCMFNDCGAAGTDSSYGRLVVNMAKPENPIYCHTCGVRGNLLTLMWGMKHRSPPSSGRLRGQEFKEIVADLQAIRGNPPPTQPVRSASASAPPAPAPDENESEPQVNVPLKDSDNERARALVNLHEQGTLDPGQMTPDARRYLDARPYLTQEHCQKWKVTYLPSQAKGTLRGRFIYPIESQRGEVLAWVGRDPSYEAKRAQWLAADKPEKQEPIKHRFPKDFHRGLELFGQQARRLREEGYRETISEIGILMVEGMNDVIRLDALQIPAVGIMSNKITDEQVLKVVRWARQLAGGKVTVMFDTDQRGEEGAKDAVWQLSQHGPVLQAWSSAAFGGKFADCEPESLSFEEWHNIREAVSRRWNGE